MVELPTNEDSCVLFAGPGDGPVLVSCSSQAANVNKAVAVVKQELVYVEADLEGQEHEGEPLLVVTIH